jgi:DNA-binding transcriptional LysR family regulator
MISSGSRMLSNVDVSTQRSENQMDLRQLQFAVTVEEEHNFTRAAARCHIAQSGLSHQIAQLEREVGAPLFHRTSRSVRLTQAGHVFLPYARRLVRDAEEALAAVAALRGVVPGQLRIGAIPFGPGPVDLLGLLQDFREGYPAVEVVVSDEGSLTTIAAIAAGHVDAAFVGLLRHQVPDGLYHQVLALEPLVAVVGPHHPLHGVPAVDMRTLADCSRFLESHPDSGLRAQVDALCTRARIRRQVVCEMRNPADLAALALRGLGVAIVPLRVAQMATSAGPEPSVLRLADPQAMQPVAFVHRDPGPANPAVQAFIRLVHSRWPPASQPTQLTDVPT